MTNGASAPGLALEATNLTKRYRRSSAPALQNVSVAMPTGSFTALVGPNGAGKSTLIRSWMGFEAPSEGTVRVAGFDPRRGRTALSQVGYIGQRLGLHGDLTVAAEIDYVAALRRGFDRPSAIRRAGELGLDASRTISRLSGGQQAQLGLVLALFTGAPILILDEPLASLDPLARRQFLSIVAEEVRAEGRTALIASHIVDDLDGLCDRIVVLVAAQVRLDDSMAHAKASHLTRSADEPGSGGTAVGEFVTADGRRRRLFRGVPEPSDQLPSLSDLVLGYLAMPTGVA